jgi:endoglucanase
MPKLRYATRLSLAFCFLVLLNGVLCIAAAAQAASSSNELAFSRARLLQRGINLSGWFGGGGGDYSDTYLQSFITDRDLKQIHAMGLDYVRLPVDPVPIMRSGVRVQDSERFLAQLDKAIDSILAAGLSVDIAVFPNGELKQGLQTQRGVDDFISLWRFLAGHFAKYDPDHVFLEILNEPEVQDVYRWAGIQGRAVNAIRSVDPRHTIIATAGRWSGLDDLLQLEPVSDNNTIYTFHFYEPYQFTHQGATWGSSEWLYYKAIPYPATYESMQAQLSQIPDEIARYQLFLYANGGWSLETFQRKLAFAAEWGRARHVPVICNEFGAYRDRAPADSRARWITDVRTALEQQHIGWAMWDYSGNFGLVKRGSSDHAPDEPIVQALGLKIPAGTVAPKE